MYHPAWIEIDLLQFRRNLAIIRRHIEPSLFCLPVKANAYGHGLCEIGLEAQRAGIDYLAVAHLQEGVRLRQAGVRVPILVLGAIHAEQIEALIHYDLEFTISSLFKAKLSAERCQRQGGRCRVHLEVDTGMQRTGVRPSSAIELMSYLREHPCFEIKGIYSHLATASDCDDPFARQQIATFTQLLEHPLFQDPPLIRHLASSGGLSHYPHSKLDMVRPALLAFGYPSRSAEPALQQTAPCFSLKARVSYSKWVEPGSGISYGHSYTTQKRTHIVTIPVGYGDGYRRCLSNRAQVLIQGKRFPIVGTICMDQLMVDVADAPVRVGDEVVLIGQQQQEQISLLEIAALCDTTPYEVLCLFNERIPRRYLGQDLKGGYQAVTPPEESGPPIP